MEEWKEYKLSELTTILGDGLHGTPEYDENGSVYFVNGNNFENGRIVIRETTKKVSIEEAQKYQKPIDNRTIFVSINELTQLAETRDILLPKLMSGELKINDVNS